MKMTADLTSTLDPRGVAVLKRKLIAGEISPDLFKGVLKRQLVKQYDRRQSNWFLNGIKSFFHDMTETLQNARGAIRLASQVEAQPSLSKEEMLSLVRQRRL